MKTPLKVFKTERGAANYADKLNQQDDKSISWTRFEVWFWGDGFAVIDQKK